MRLILILVSMIVFLPSVLAQQAEDLVKVDLVASTKAIEGGKPFEVAVRYRLAPEWHLYWINPGDSGIPPTLKWTLPAGFSANLARFPVPRKIPAEGGILSYGYSDEVVLLVEILPPADVTGTVKLGLDTSYLVCKELCLPARHPRNSKSPRARSRSRSPNRLPFGIPGFLLKPAPEPWSACSRTTGKLNR